MTLTLHDLALWRLPGVGVKTYDRLLRAFGSAEHALRASHSALSEMGLAPGVIARFKTPPFDAAERDLTWSLSPGCHILTRGHPAYPNLLKEIPYPPPLLFLRGDPNVVSTPQLAMVGARNATPDGLAWAKYFATECAYAGLTITSGLALGIDGAAHQGALLAEGKTIAVLGCGVDVVYPKAHARLAASLAERGALVSEYPLGTEPSAKHFPRRNRLISGLSIATFVVQASLRSGSLITAHYALTQNRDVYAMPGAVGNPQSRGCHALIKQGAKCIETIEDILEDFGDQLKTFNAQISQHVVPRETLIEPFENKQKKSIHSAQNRLLSSIDTWCTPIDLILARSGLTLDEVCAMMLDLEASKHVKLVAGGYIRVP